jgi:hypothetical protein
MTNLFLNILYIIFWSSFLWVNDVKINVKSHELDISRKILRKLCLMN